MCAPCASKPIDPCPTRTADLRSGAAPDRPRSERHRLKFGRWPAISPSCGGLLQSRSCWRLASRLRMPLRRDRNHRGRSTGARELRNECPAPVGTRPGTARSTSSTALSAPGSKASAAAASPGRTEPGEHFSVHHPAWRDRALEAFCEFGGKLLFYCAIFGSGVRGRSRGSFPRQIAYPDNAPANLSRV